MTWIIDKTSSTNFNMELNLSTAAAAKNRTEEAHLPPKLNTS